jgi:predicted cupin superfamily sugar epimerase
VVALVTVDPPGARSPLVERLGLVPHPEGGWYRQTWRASVSFVPDGYDGERSAATAIYFLLHPGERSRWHVVRSDELWLWHRGGPLELSLGGPGERPSVASPGRSSVVLGGDVQAGEVPQALVPGGVWQAAAPAGPQPVLVSCVVSPGFDFGGLRMD